MDNLKINNVDSTQHRAPAWNLPEDDRVVGPDQMAELARLDRFATTAQTATAREHRFGKDVMAVGLADLRHQLPSGIEAKDQ